MYDTSISELADETVSVKAPSMSVATPFEGLPFSTTLAPIIVSPESSTTTPFTVMSAYAHNEKKDIAAKMTNFFNLINLKTII